VIDWAARLKVVTSERRQATTDETDERVVSSAMSVVDGFAKVRREEVSSVSSVLLVVLSENCESESESEGSTTSGCEVFEERAAIMEFDAGMTRPEAGLRAQGLICKNCRNRGGYR
jgi:hypothetical protein